MGEKYLVNDGDSFFADYYWVFLFFYSEIMNHMTDLPYRENVSMWVFNQEKKFLTLDDATKERYFKFPQGGVDAGESLEQAVARELLEEVNILSFQLISKAAFERYYDWPAELQQKNKMRGQHQHFFLIFLADDSTVRIMEEKIRAIKWLTFDEIINQFPHANMTVAYQKVWEEFGPLVKSWPKI